MEDEPVVAPEAEHGDGRSVRSHYDWSSTDASTAVVETVALATDRDPMEMDQLYDAVDTDALDRVVQSGSTTPPGANVTVTFAFGDRQVTVHANGDVVVRADEPRTHR